MEEHSQSDPKSLPLAVGCSNLYLCIGPSSHNSVAMPAAAEEEQRERGAGERQTNSSRKRSNSSQREREQLADRSAVHVAKRFMRCQIGID